MIGEGIKRKQEHHQCAQCKTPIPRPIAITSKHGFGEPLCLDCQANIIDPFAELAKELLPKPKIGPGHD